MSPKIAVLLVALLLLAGCAPAATPAPSWAMEELTFIASVTDSLDKLEADFVAGGDKELADARNRLLHLQRTPPAPATLAVIDYSRGRVAYLCSDTPTTDCLSAISALRLELARLYAARGSYPPTSQP